LITDNSLAGNMPFSFILEAPSSSGAVTRVFGSCRDFLGESSSALPIGTSALARLGGKVQGGGEGKEAASAFPESAIVIPVGITPANLKKYTLYEILGFGGEWGASADTEAIKRAYHKAVLMYHPDKAQFKMADGKEDRSVFLKIQEAFNVLCSEPKRRAYDSQLPFDESVPSEEQLAKSMAKGPHKFFKLFDPVFKRNARFAVKKPVPELGDMDTPLPAVYKFYDYWIKFESWRDFTGIGAEHKPDDASCREEKRWMQKENERLAKKLKTKEMERIIAMVMLAEKKDPRIAKDKEAKKEAKEAGKNAKEADAKRQAEEEAGAKQWSESLEQAVKDGKSKSKEEKEKLKKAQSKARNTFRKLLRVTAALGKGSGEYGVLGEDKVELICQNMEIEDVNAMNTAMGGEAATKDNAAFLEQGIDVVLQKLARAESLDQEVLENDRIIKDAIKREKEERSSSERKRAPGERVGKEEESAELRVALERFAVGYTTTSGSTNVSRFQAIAYFLAEKTGQSFSHDECLIQAWKLSRDA